MATSRYRKKDLQDHWSIKPWKHPKTSEGRSLTTEEIRRLYPGVNISEKRRRKTVVK